MAAPSDLGWAVRLLASPEAGHITGKRDALGLQLCPGGHGIGSQESGLLDDDHPARMAPSEVSRDGHHRRVVINGAAANAQGALCGQ